MVGVAATNMEESQQASAGKKSYLKSSNGILKVLEFVSVCVFKFDYIFRITCRWSHYIQGYKKRLEILASASGVWILFIDNV